MSSSDQYSNQKLHLLALPPELREAIYILALVSHSEILLGYPGPNPNCHTTSLLSVNRQIRAETLQLFWSLNIFQSCTSTSSKAILRALPFDTLKHITCWKATDASNITSTALFATTTLHRARMMLNALHGEFVPRGMRSEALRVPINVEGEEDEGVQWVCMGDMSKLEAKIVNGDWKVVRK